jgi:hypothetical protein
MVKGAHVNLLHISRHRSQKIYKKILKIKNTQRVPSERRRVRGRGKEREGE